MEVFSWGSRSYIMKLVARGSCAKCNHSLPSSGNGSAHDMTYNWGANVSTGGESMRVVDWLDTNMTAENMMKNLL